MTPSDDARIAEILDIVAAETEIERERLTLDARIDALGIASIDMVQTVFALETRFGVELPVLADQPGGEFATVGDLVRHVQAAIRAQHPQALQAGG